MSPRILIATALTLVATALAGILHAATPGFGAFVAAAAALAFQAWLVSFATEQIGERFGPGATGLLQSTLGNLPELFVVIFALRAGQTVVATTSIIGSFFANALLVLGITFVVGALRSPGGIMRYSPRLPNDNATLSLLASFVIVLVSISVGTHDHAAKHVVGISVGAAIFLLMVYIAWVIGYLRADVAPEAVAESEHTVPPVPLAISGLLLVIGGVGSAFVSDWFVAGLDPAVSALHISKAFAGLVLVAIAGNAVENVAAISLAWKGRADLAVSVVKNSVAQVAAFLFPLLVLISMLFSHHLTFQLAPVYAAALALTAITVWQITADGESQLFEGVALVALYAILATVTLYE